MRSAQASEVRFDIEKTIVTRQVVELPGSLPPAPDDAKNRGIESGDQVMLYSGRVARHKNTILGVKGDDFQFSSLMKNGHIELTKAAVTAVAIVTPAIKKSMMYANMLDMRQPSNSLQPAVVDWISGNYNYKMGVARVKKLGESKYKKEFRSMSFAPRNIG